MLPLDVTLWVLLGALFHASWNAFVKSSEARTFDIVGMHLVAAILAVAGIPFLSPLEPACVPWLLGSAVLQVAYFIGVAQAYRAGDLSQTYPIMRGLAPVLVALAGVILLDERLGSGGVAGIILIATGIILPVWVSARGVRPPGSGTLAACLTAALIASYTLVDGIGARLSGNAANYGLWLFLLQAVPITAYGIAHGPRVLGNHLRAHWLRSVVCGILMVGSYLIALWAMTRAPVAAVAALRETSVVFAALIGTLVLREGFGRWRVAGALLVVCGVLALKI